MTLLLASVRDLAEAREAALAGADLIDLKEPREGALGAVAPAVIRQVTASLRRRWPGQLVSATIGDFAPDDLSGMVRMADVTGRCGVDYVKAGIVPGPHARTALARLARLRWQVVPVFLVDVGLDPGLDLSLVKEACTLGFPALMADTADKTAGSLFDCVAVPDLTRFVRLAHAHGLLAGLAGALRPEHLPALRALSPDIAGFRGALCEDGRAGRLDPARVRALRQALVRGTVGA